MFNEAIHDAVKLFMDPLESPVLIYSARQSPDSTFALKWEILLIARLGEIRSDTVAFTSTIIVH